MEESSGEHIASTTEAAADAEARLFQEVIDLLQSCPDQATFPLRLSAKSPIRFDGFSACFFLASRISVLWFKKSTRGQSRIFYFSPDIRIPYLPSMQLF